MATGEQIPLQPSLAGVLGEYLHDASIGRQMVVIVIALRQPGAIGGVEQGAQAIGHGLVRAHDPEIALHGVESHHVAQIDAQGTGRFPQHTARLWHFQGIVVVDG